MSIIVLTAGHSSTDPGACSGGYTEAGLMLELRDVTAELLRDLGHVVIEDGDDGENLPLRHAISLIEQAPSPLSCTPTPATTRPQGAWRPSACPINVSSAAAWRRWWPACWARAFAAMPAG